MTLHNRLRPANPGTPKNLGRGNLWGWISPRVVIAQENVPYPKIFLAAVDDTLRKQIFADSTAGVPKLGGKYFVFADFRDTSEGAIEDLWGKRNSRLHPLRVRPALEPLREGSQVVVPRLV